jgi:hypothetical protein
MRISIAGGAHCPTTRLQAGICITIELGNGRKVYSEIAKRSQSNKYK